MADTIDIALLREYVQLYGDGVPQAGTVIDSLCAEVERLQSERDAEKMAGDIVQSELTRVMDELEKVRARCRAVSLAAGQSGRS